MSEKCLNRANEVSAGGVTANLVNALKVRPGTAGPQELADILHQGRACLGVGYDVNIPHVVTQAGLS
jgi:hypothetical protein